MTTNEIIGTKWYVIQTPEDLPDSIFEFCKNGLLKYKESESKWEIKGDKIIISHNNGYAILTGQIIEKKLIGKAINKKGDNWTFEGKLLEKSGIHLNEGYENILLNQNEMQKLIDDFYEIVKDYRSDEKNPLVVVTKESIKNWINQFDEIQRIPILTELNNIFNQRYCSKSEIKEFISLIISTFTKDFKFSNEIEFLKNADFLNLQPVGKSQGVMLALLEEIIKEKYNLSLNECGSLSKKYSIYLDDILCTGLTLISDVKEWSEKEFIPGKTNKQAVADNSTVLVFAYVFIHDKNYHKKVAEMRHKVSNDVSNKHKMYRLIAVENGIGQSSKIDLILPLENNLSDDAINYKNSIIERVNIHTKKYNTESPDEFFRPKGLPENEKFFTSSENRIIVENEFLKRGIEILQNANPTNKNMRALGYSIPSLKNFGFGALCFTWRNVPNNAPLVFWYKGGNFTPLFVVKRGDVGNFNINLPEYIL